jgi:predicted RNA-binding protein YlxR (DUF448 family)
VLAEIAASETDEGPAAARRAPERLCLATRQVKPTAELLRFVVAPDGAIVPDLAGNLPGRGAWVTATRDALATALRSNAFGRAFRGKGTAAPDLADRVERLLERAALESLSLVNKAGQVLFGFAKVEAALAEGRLSALVQAREAAADGVAKLSGALARGERAGKPAPVRVRGLSGEQLDLAFGRSNVVHAGLLAHPASRGFLARWLRLERWRTGSAGGETAAVGRGASDSETLGSE